MPPTCRSGASSVAQVMLRSADETSAKRPAVNQFFHALGIWSASGSMTPRGKSSSILWSGTLNGKATLTFAVLLDDVDVHIEGIRPLGCRNAQRVERARLSVIAAKCRISEVLVGPDWRIRPPSASGSLDDHSMVACVRPP